MHYSQSTLLFVSSVVILDMVIVVLKECKGRSLPVCPLNKCNLLLYLGKLRRWAYNLTWETRDPKKRTLK